jgi:hypothetical protein
MGLTVRRAGALPWPVKAGATGADYRFRMRIPRPGRFELVAASFLAVTVVFAVQTAHGWTGADFGIYGRAGGTLLSLSSLHAYHSPLIQAGPLELALDGALWHMHGWPVALAIVSDLLVALLLVGAVLMFVGRRTAALALVCGGALALGLVTHPYTLGHFAEPISAVLWIAAARDAQRGRVVRAGVLVGLSSALEPWGLLGVAVLALAPSLRSAAKGGAVAGGVFLLLFGPWLLSGDFQMLTFHWYVTGGPLALVIPGHSFGWSLRLLQALVTLAIVVPLARRVRGLGAAIFIVPAATAIVRLAIDPLGTYYYWDTPLVIELVGAAAAIASLDSIHAWAGNRLGRIAPSA